MRRIEASSPDEPLRPGEDWPEWGYRTGRYGADRIAFWRGQLDGERRIQAAAARSEEPSDVAAVIRSLYPIVAENGRLIQAAGPPTRPQTRLQELDWALDGPPQEARYALQDAEAEAELAAHDAQQVQAAAEGLTEDEYQALFGDAD